MYLFRYSFNCLKFFPDVRRIDRSSNNSLNIGDAAILENVAFSGSWNWKEFDSDASKLTQLAFGDYDFPTKGESSLGRLKFTDGGGIVAGHRDRMVQKAASMKEIELIQCLNERYCLPEKPKVSAGLRGETTDVFVDNAAFRDFLFRKFKVSTVDEVIRLSSLSSINRTRMFIFTLFKNIRYKNCSVLRTCLSNGVLCVVFRGVYDIAGGGANGRFTELSLLAWLL